MPTPEIINSQVMGADEARRDALYAFLRGREGWIPMQDLAYYVKDIYPTYGWVSNFHNSHIRRKLTADIEAINGDPKYERVIISGNRGVKIADNDELDRFLRSEYKEIFRKLDRVRRFAKKAYPEGQFTLFSNLEELVAREWGCR